LQKLEIGSDPKDTSTYDPDGRVSSVINPAGIAITYGYDAASQRASMNQPTGLFTYTHDAVGRMTKLVNPEAQVTSWVYDKASRVLAMQMANGTLVSNTYDNASQLLLLANLTASGSTLSSFNYTYNPVGNRTQVVEANGDVLTLSYDPTYQLTNEKRSGANSYNISYTYDPVGNRTVLTNSGALTTNTYNAGNELVTSQASAGVTTSTYDGDGNLLTTLAPGNQLTTNTWDGENRLTRTALPSGIVDSFTYNGDGLRVQKQDTTGTTNHVWDGQNVLLETNASNIIQVVYSLQPMLYGNLISQVRSGTTSFYLFDGLGSTTQLANATGSVTDSYIYDSFGNILLTSGSTVNPFRYVGRSGYYLDIDLVQYYLRARHYYPSVGRFLSRDTIALSFVSGWYQYVANNPARLKDPSGLQVTMGQQPKPPKPPKPPRRPVVAPPTHLGTKWNFFGWGYGWYCGWNRYGQDPNTGKNISPPVSPIDGLDAACQVHDQCLATKEKFCTPERQFVCDALLCLQAQTMAATGCNQDYPVDDEDWDPYFDCVQAAKDVARLYCGLTLIPNPPPKGGLLPIPVPPIRIP
jgi:RHS repeat-associated protein